MDSNRARRTLAYQRVNSASSVVELLAPDPVVEAAGVLVSRCHHPHLLERRVEAESSYTDSVRKDLGYPATSQLPGFEYEDYIDFSGPDIGLTTG